jgi:tetratricopeptide (TPR) repeat protein
MKPVCPICGTRKAKRQCLRQGLAAICPPCCADTRDESCGDCAHYAAAQAYRATRATPKTPPEGDFIVEINPEVEQAVNRILALAEHRPADESRTMMEDLLRDNPGNHTVYFGMGVLHVMQGEPRQSIRWFDQATEIYPYFVEAHFNKALAHQKDLDIANAVRAYRKVVDVGDPEEQEVQQARELLADIAAGIRRHSGIDLDTYLESHDAFKRAFALMEQGAWNEALAGFREAAAKNDRSPPTHGNMGLCLARLGRKAEALAQLDRALELDPDYTPARINRRSVEWMEEGTPLKIARFESIEFGRAQALREREDRTSEPDA